MYNIMQLGITNTNIFKLNAAPAESALILSVNPMGMECLNQPKLSKCLGSHCHILTLYEPLLRIAFICIDNVHGWNTSLHQI